MMDDLLSRKAVIDAIYKNGCNTRRILDAVEALPSVHPEPITARLEPLQTTTIYESGETYTAGCLPAWVCDNCKAIYNTKPSTKKPDFDFCPKCGAKFEKYKLGLRRNGGEW